MTVISPDFDGLFLGCADAFERGDLPRLRDTATMMIDAAMEAESDLTPAGILVAKAIHHRASVEPFMHVKMFHAGFGVRMMAEFANRQAIPQSFFGPPMEWVEFQIKVVGISDYYINRKYRPPFHDGHAIDEAVGMAKVTLSRIERRQAIHKAAMDRQKGRPKRRHRYEEWMEDGDENDEL